MGDIVSTINVDTIKNSAGTGLPTNLQPVTASSWVYVNGVGESSILGNHNVGSLTDNGVGDYSITFAVALNNANYSSVIGSDRGQSFYVAAANKSAASLRIQLTNSSGGDFIDGVFDVVTFGGQS